jgi:hypothetical protein
MKKGIIIVFLMLATSVARTQDYFRSVTSGDWSSTTTWESSINASVWVPAISVPNSAANTIWIRNGHTVSVSTSVSADQLVIENGGTLDHTGGIFTIDDEPGDDLDIQNGGVFVLSVDATVPNFTASANVNVATGGILRVSASGLTSTAGGGVHLPNFVYQHQSVLEYTLTLPFGSLGITYFPNVNSATIPIFRVTANSAVLLVGSNSNTTFNGLFEITGTATVRWRFAGDKIFRNGIRNTGDMDFDAGTIATAKFKITGATAELGGGGSLLVPGSTGLEIGSNTTVTMVSNKTVTGNISLQPDTYIELGAYSLTVTGTIIITPVTTSYVKTNGMGVLILNSVGASGKSFPVGNSTFNPVYISSLTSTNLSLRVEDGINPPIYNNARAVLKTWVISSSVSSPSVFFNFGYTLPTDAGGSFNASGTVEVGYHIATWNLFQSSLSQTPLGGGAYVVSTTIPFTAFSPNLPISFVIANTGSVLPADYFIFAKAQKINATGWIEWNIADVDQVRDFVIERSANGSAWRQIATILPVSNKLHYSFTDGQLMKGRNFYRIRVNRFSGITRYSNTVALINGANGLLITSLIPSPVHASASITVSAAKTGVVTFKIYDISGKMIMQWKSLVTAGTSGMLADMRDMAPGIYHIKACTSDGLEQAVYRFLKQ